jgi:hypothetical protein
MQRKYRTSLIVVAVSLALIWLLYYMGGRAIAFMVKMHGG